MGSSEGTSTDIWALETCVERNVVLLFLHNGQIHRLHLFRFSHTPALCLSRACVELCSVSLPWQTTALFTVHTRNGTVHQQLSGGITPKCSALWEVEIGGIKWNYIWRKPRFITSIKTAVGLLGLFLLSNFIPLTPSTAEELWMEEVLFSHTPSVKVLC